MRSNYAGVDWASEKHDVLVQNAAGEELLAATFAHDEAGLRSLSRSARAPRRGAGRDRATRGGAGRAAPGRRPAGAGLAPQPGRRGPPAVPGSGGKSDRFDSFVLCELARTDSHRFRVVEPDSDQTKALRALCRGRENLVGTRVALSNQLRAELERFWLGAVKIFRSLDSPIALAFLERYPSPIEARTLGEQRLAAFLARQHYSGGKAPRELLRKLRSAPEGRGGEQEIAMRRQLVLALVALLRPLVAQIKQLERQIARALAEHPDGQLFRPLFRDPKSVLTAAELVAEIGDCRSRYPTAEALAGDAGQAAVAIESGKRKVACYRWACNKRLRDALCTLADSTRHWHPWAGDHYARALAKGHDHPRAIRGLGRAWCRVIWRCWQDRTPYDPARHRALQRHVTVIIPTASGPVVDQAATQRMAAGLMAPNRPARQPEVSAPH